jgi:hypothetical protein
MGNPAQPEISKPLEHSMSAMNVSAETTITVRNILAQFGGQAYSAMAMLGSREKDVFREATGRHMTDGCQGWISLSGHSKTLAPGRRSHSILTSSDQKINHHQSLTSSLDSVMRPQTMKMKMNKKTNTHTTHITLRPIY